MPWLEVIWLDGPGGNLQHLADGAVTQTEVEQALREPIRIEESDSSGRPIAFGYTEASRRIAVVYEQIDPVTVYPITAYPVQE